MKLSFFIKSVLCISLFSMSFISQAQDTLLADQEVQQALAYRNQGQLVLAKSLLKKAFPTYAHYKKWEKYYETKNALIKTYWIAHEIDSAESLAVQLLEEMPSKLGPESLQSAETHSHLGVVGDLRSDFDFAIEHYKISLAIRLKKLGPESLEVGKTYFNMAMYYYSQNIPNTALEYYAKVHHIFEATLPPNHPYWPMLFENMGATYKQIIDYESANKYFSKAVKSIVELYGPQAPQLARLYLNQTIVLNSIWKKNIFNNQLYLNTNSAEIVKHSFKALEIAQTIMAPHLLGKYYQVIGQALVIDNQLEEGLKKQHFAIDLLTKQFGPKNAEVAQAYFQLAILYEQQKQFNTVLAVYQKSMLAILPEVDSLPNIFEIPDLSETPILSFHLLSSIIDNQINITHSLIAEQPDSILFFQQKLKNHAVAADRIIDRVQLELSQEQDQRTALIPVFNAIKNSISNYLVLGGEENQTIAFHLSEKLKSTVIKKALLSSSANRFGGIPSDISKKEKELKTAITTLKNSISQAKLEGKSSLNLDLEQQLFDKRTTFEDLLQQMEKDYPKYKSLKYTKLQSSITDIQNQLLDENSLLIEYVHNETQLCIFEIGKHHFKTHHIPNNQKLTPLINNFRLSCSNSQLLVKEPLKSAKLYHSSAYKLYEYLLKDVLEGKDNIEHLIIIPDGILSKIPFEALLTKAAAEDSPYQDLDFVLKKYSVQYSYSADLLIQNKKIIQPKNGKILAFAASYDKSLDLSKSTRTKEEQRLRAIFNDLPGAKKEVQQLQETYAGTFLFGQEANERIFKNSALEDYAVIHFAMHGHMNAKNPMSSSLIFSEDQDSIEDNFVYAYELTNMHIPANLIVLSACETGDGVIDHTEGVMSLARSFMYAGTPSLIMTLWQVNDASTAIIMTHFYENLQQGMLKSTALQQAKISYLEIATGKSAHPNFWSPFIQLGDARPISITAKGSEWLWYIAGVLGLMSLIGIAAAVRRKAA